MATVLNIRKSRFINKLALFFLPLVLCIVPQTSMYFQNAVGQAIFVVTAVTMPTSALNTIENHFGKIEISTSLIPSLKLTIPNFNIGIGNKVENDLENENLDGEEKETVTGLPFQLFTPEYPAPEIPEEYQGELLWQTMVGSEDSEAFVKWGNSWVRNYTDLTSQEIEEILSTRADITVYDSNQPQVLIYHTHTTESYENYDSKIYDIRNNWRDTDNNKNMATVGAALTYALEQEGINVIHDVVQHDYPEYNGAYERSRATIQDYLDKYPSIQIIFDLHRDGIVGMDDEIKKPVVEINGEKAAQLMIIAPCDESGNLNIPNWAENLRFAVDIISAIETDNPNLCRPIFFDYRKYNFDMLNGALLFEVGSNANTLSEAVYTAQLIAPAIADVINSYVIEVDDSWILQGDGDMLTEVS